MDSSEKNLSESERYYRTLIHSLHENLLVIDRDFRVTDINNTALKTLGKTRQEVIGRFCYEVTYSLNEPCDEHSLPCPLQKVFDTGEPISCRHEHVTSKGTMVHIDVLASPIKDSKGNVTHIIKAVRDISDQLEAQEALRASEEKLGEAARIAHVGWWERDYLAETITLSEEACQIFGLPQHYRFSELTGWHEQWKKLIHPEDQHRTVQAAADALASGPPYNVNYRVIRPNGEVRYVHSYAEVKRDESGKPLRMFGTMIDITERVQTEEALKESENRYMDFYENAPDMYALVNAKTALVEECNITLANTLGYSKEEIIGRPVFDLYHPDCLEEVKKTFKLFVKTGEIHDKELQLRRKDGLKVDVSLNASAVRDENGHILLSRSTQRDITDRKQVEETLRKNEERYRELYERSPLAYESLDVKGCFINVNEAWLDMLGYTREEVIGQWCGNFLAPHQVELFRERFPLFKTAGKVHTEFDMKHKDGSIITVAVDGKIGYDEKGDFKQTHCILNDITERKKVEQEIRKLTEELEQRVVKRTAQLEAVNKELEAFAYSVSHDLRTPLRHIDGFIGLLQKRMETTLDEKSRHYMDTISASTKRMDMLIRDLLSFSRMGSYKMSKRPVDIGVLVREIIREFETEIGNRDINWRVGDLPVVTGDRAMLHMVLVNLISNALKFTQPRQSAEIEIGWMPDKKTETIIFVRDNGVGFDMNYADKLFGVFQRLHRSDEFEGTGIGLANVRRIISRHGGRTWAMGEVNQGATFYFSLPYNNVRSFERSG